MTGINERKYISANTQNKETVREERAKISPAALIKLAFLLLKTINLKTYPRQFEEECCMYVLRLKQNRSNKWRKCSFALKNKQKLGLFLMEAVFKSKFTDFRKLTHGLWRKIERKDLLKLNKLINGSLCSLKFEDCRLFPVTFNLVLQFPCEWKLLILSTHYHAFPLIFNLRILCCINAISPG